MKKKSERLGNHGGIKEILQHPFFEGLDIAKLNKKELKPEYMPEITDGELKYFDQKLVNDDQLELSVIPQNRQKIIDKNK